MSNYNVVFGTRRVTRAAGGFQKFPDNAVVTVEGQAEKGKNRRLLFNKNSMETLNLTDGASQELVLVFIESDENGNRRLLIANTAGSDIDSGIQTYSTSKSRTASYKESKEKGKSVTGKALLEEIADFLSMDSASEHEYYINPFNTPEGFPSTGLSLFEFVNVNGAHSANGDITEKEEEKEEETNNLQSEPIDEQDAGVIDLDDESNSAQPGMTERF